jgi:hypothetical protein
VRKNQFGMRKAVLGVLAVVTAIAVSGCVAFDGGPSTAQVHGIGPLALNFEVCAQPSSGTSQAGACAVASVYSEAETDPSQIWLGFEVPKGTGLPSSFKSTRIGPDYSGKQITFTGRHWYSTGLESLYPAKAGYEWAGYVSLWEDDYSSTSGPQNFTATIDFGLPRGKNGKPFAGPFQYEAVVGGQQYDQGGGSASAKPGDSTPDCGEALGPPPFYGVGYGTEDGPDGSAYEYDCANDLSPAEGAFKIVGIKNAAVLPGKEVSAFRGSTKKVRFTFDYTGKKLGAAFKFIATTNLHGAKTSVSPTTFNPTGTSSKTVTVKVKVPAAARSGTYKVKLTAKLANGQSRTATAELKVH